MGRTATLPLRHIPKFCQECGHPIPSEERDRYTHPFKCSNPAGSHLIFVSPKPVAVHILLVRLADGELGVALGRRGLEYEVAYGKWALPGGFIEAETGQEAAIGEFWEELRVDVSEVQTQHVDECYDASTHCSIHFYAGLWPYAQLPELQATKESSEVQICPVNALPNDLAFPYQPDIIRRAASQYR